MKKFKCVLQKGVAALLVLCMGLAPCITDMNAVFAEEPEPTYQVSLTDSEHGQITFVDSKEQAKEFKEGDKVTLAVSPEEGYALERLAILSAETEEEAAHSEDADTEFTFTMPAGNLTVQAAFKEAAPETPSSNRVDITKDTDSYALEQKDYKDIDWTQYGLDGINAQKELLNSIGVDPENDENYGSAWEKVLASTPMPMDNITDWAVGSVHNGGAAVAQAWHEEGGQSYFVLDSFSGGLAGAEMIGTGWCADHTAALPFPGIEVVSVTATVTSVDVAGGWVTLSLLLTPIDVTDGVTSNEHGLIGYQHIGANIRIHQDFNGKAQLKKQSTNTSLTNGNSCYSLAGAVYGVYSDQNCTAQVATLTTDANGNTNIVEIPSKNYFVKEQIAPKGFLKDERVYPITVTASQTATVSVSDVPGNDPAAITLNKIDAETGDIILGAASLEGAQFTVKYYDGYYTKENLPKSATRTWVLETQKITNPNTGEVRYRTKLSNECKVSGDDFYYLNGNTDPTLPLGTITIEETKAPTGYLLEGSYLKPVGSETATKGMYLSQITMESGMVSLVGGNEFAISDRVIRGDIELVKADEESQERMANIPFRITSKTTGETHTFLTDENGYYSSSNEFNAHDHDTNGGKVDSGLYFGMDADGNTVKADNAHGALPYDTYTIEELRCSANTDKALYKGTITVSRENYVVDMGTIDNPDLTLATTAIDEETQTHYSNADEEVTLLDTVRYTGLKKGSEYVLTGTLISKETGDALLDRKGNAITATKTFKAPTAEGEAEVEFTFDGKALGGSDIVVYEELSLKGKIIAEHKDLNDTDQTIHFPEIGTKASDSETNTNVTKADKEVTLIDTVSYKNLRAGKKYSVTGTLMDQKTGEKVKDANGLDITAEASFTAEESSGTVEVKFVFDGSNLAGETVVVFEELYRGDKLLAVHADIKDEAQTVMIPKIKTTAKDEESDSKNSLADSQITIVDTVSYENLIPGQEYTVKGTLMDQETGKAVKAKVGTSKENTFEIPEGAEELSFEAGTYAYVAKGTEKIASGMYRKNETGFVKVGSEEPTIEIPEESITWTETFKKEATGYLLDGKVTLAPETTYEMSKDAKEVTAEAVFTAEKESGTVDVTFVFDGTGLEETTFVVFEDLFMNEISVAAHTDIKDEGQTIYVPGIHTTAKDSETGTQNSLADKTVKVVDTVTYQNLIPGKEYVVSGTFMDKETGKALLVNEKEVTGETTFTPEKPSGKVDVTFEFDGSKLQNKTLVVFESLTLEKQEVAIHADIKDKDQTIYFPEIGTTATDKEDGDKDATADNSVTIEDKIAYENLVPGQSYTAVGTLMEKESGKALLIGGKEVTAKADFTPEEATGTVSVEFTFDGTGLGGKSLVVYEKVYTTDTGIEVANHEDLNDEGQTVKLVTPPKATVQTGDNWKMYGAIALAVVLLAGAGILLFRKKKK